MKIALLSESWNRFYTMSPLEGMFARAKERGFSISVAQFASFGDWCKNESFNEGEYAIFKMIDFTDFDAIVLDVSDMKLKDIETRILPIISKLNIPVIAIDCKFPGIHYISHNNYDAITRMMDHLHDEHSVKSFAFFGGPVGTYESDVRKEAFIDSIERFGLSIENNPAYDGSYEAVSGELNFEKMLKDGHKLPEAIVCCNDRIAIGALEAAKKNGYECPRDFKITGFDNYGDAERYSPQITTVGFDRVEAGKKIIDVLCDLSEGKEIDEFVSVEGKMIFRESCGCNSEAQLDYREYAKASVLNGIRINNKNSTLTSLMAELSFVEDFNAYFKSLSEFTNFKGDATACVIADKALFSPTEYKLCEGSIPEERQVAAFYLENGKRIEDICDMNNFNDALKHTRGDVYSNSVVFISSLHFGSKIVGYYMTKKSSDNLQVPDFLDAKYRFLFAGESLFKHLRQLAFSKTLEGLYKRDQLTGVHNRIFFEEEMIGKFAKLVKEDKQCAVLFVDADNFKQINDNYGHAKGDKILKKIASTLHSFLPKGGHCCRYGGDEFVAYVPCQGKVEAKKLAKNIEKQLKASGISVSIGISLSKKSLTNLTDYVHLADKDMYINKFSKLGDRRGRVVRID